MVSIMDNKDFMHTDIDSNKDREQIKIEPHNRVLFIGDSITDAGRDYGDSDNLGRGYAHLIAAHLSNKYPDYDLKFYNRGINGNKVLDIKNRWEEDCLALNPDVVSILVGINDVWHRVDADEEQNEETYAQFEEDFRYLLKSLAQRSDARVVIVEPFVLPYPKDRNNWRQYLDPRIHIIRRIANDYHAALIPMDGILNAKGIENGFQTYTGNDGVHPTLTGHALIAETWLQQLNLN